MLLKEGWTIHRVTSETKKDTTRGMPLASLNSSASGGADITIGALAPGGDLLIPVEIYYTVPPGRRQGAP
jgi:hypothetical protein